MMIFVYIVHHTHFKTPVAVYSERTERVSHLVFTLSTYLCNLLVTEVINAFFFSNYRHAISILKTVFYYSVLIK